MSRLAIRHDSENVDTLCSECGRTLSCVTGPTLVAETSAAPVCRDCGRRQAPSLVALLDLARTAQRVVRVHRRSLVPPIDALLDLARAAEDYTLLVRDRRRRAA